MLGRRCPRKSRDVPHSGSRSTATHACRACEEEGEQQRRGGLTHAALAVPDGEGGWADEGERGAGVMRRIAH